MSSSRQRTRMVVSIGSDPASTTGMAVDGSERAMNVTCTICLSAETGNCAHRPRDIDEVGDHLHGLESRGVGVRPARDLVQVVADARDLPRALALDLGRRRGPGARPRHRLPQQVGQRHADSRRLGAPVGELRRRHAGVDSHDAAISHQRTGRMERGRRRPLSREPDLGARQWGSEGGRSSPSPDSHCTHNG